MHKSRSIVCQQLVLFGFPITSGIALLIYAALAVWRTWGRLLSRLSSRQAGLEAGSPPGLAAPQSSIAASKELYQRNPALTGGACGVL